MPMTFCEARVRVRVGLAEKPPVSAPNQRGLQEVRNGVEGLQVDSGAYVTVLDLGNNVVAVL